MTQDIAIAHKDYAVAGGGEILAERLGRCFDAPVYTGYLNDTNRPDNIGADVRDLFGNRPIAGRMIERGGITRQLIYRHLWKRADPLTTYDTIIQSGMEPLWYQPRDRQTTLTYLHSTPRLQYDLYHYLHTEPETLRDWIRTTLAELYHDRVRRDMLPQTNYPDLWVCNSDLVERRVHRYYGIPPEQTRVVYPPVDTDDLGPENAVSGYDTTFLSVNRLDEWKRIDEIIDAFATLEYELLIAGKGPEEDALRDHADASDNIRFLGYVPEPEKRELLASVDAVVYNALNEDFGMVPIEAIASGTPVISVRDGFQRYQLTDGVNAILYDRDITDRDTTVRNLESAVRRYVADGVSADAAGMVEWAEQFSISRFESQMQDAVDTAHRLSEVESSITPPLPQTASEEVEAVADGGDP